MRWRRRSQSAKDAPSGPASQLRVFSSFRANLLDSKSAELHGDARSLAPGFFPEPLRALLIPLRVLDATDMCCVVFWWWLQSRVWQSVGYDQQVWPADLQAVLQGNRERHWLCQGDAWRLLGGGGGTVARRAAFY